MDPRRMRLSSSNVIFATIQSLYMMLVIDKVSCPYTNQMPAFQNDRIVLQSGYPAD
jgi:hypothetical protein